ncbi:hypothetical protein ACFSWE_15185 [Leucobacter albus]|uniref:Uncharacterized protein n=1 Tax=Leucobacter albus TaxID=272210 RepID=A0ABW3TLE9_9MICO
MTTTPTTEARSSATRPVAWSSRIDVHHLGGESTHASATPGTSRKRGSSKIEREIIWAVVVLYAGLIACFAGLHLFGLTLG